MRHNHTYTIVGESIQAVEFTLQPQEMIRAESGAMMYMDSHIKMESRVTDGLMGGLKRVMSGEQLFMTNFTNDGDTPQNIAFGAPYPGVIIPITPEDCKGRTFLCQRSSFLCAGPDIKLDIAVTRRIGAGFLGGEGFILQKLTGSGMAFIHAGGAIIERTLADNETLKVDTGCLVGLEKTVDYSIKFVGGIRNSLFGGEGLFFAMLKGPGKVFLQSLPFSRFANTLIASVKN